MKTVKPLLKPGFLSVALAIAVIVSFAGAYLFPETYGGADSIVASRPGIRALIAVASAAAVLFLSALLFETAKSLIGRSAGKRKRMYNFWGYLVLLAAFAVCALALSLIYGLLAVLLYAIFGSSLPLERIEGVILFVTSALTLATLPIFLNVVLSFGLGDGTLKEGVSVGLKTLKRTYFPLLTVAVLFFAAGRLLTIPFGFAPNAGVWIFVKTCISAVVGMPAITAAVSAYAGKVK
jgi:hypothetical protein